MNQKPKQQWKRPQLIVLGRGKPEENVLLACKTDAVAGPKSSTKCPGASCSGQLGS